MTDIGGHDSQLESEIVTAIKDVAGKKAVLSSLEQAAAAKNTRRKRLVGSMSGVAALAGAVFLYTFFLGQPPVEPHDPGACMRGGEMASDKVIELISSGKYDEALELIAKERTGLAVDDSLPEEAKAYQRQIIASETRKLDSLENYLMKNR